MKTLHFSEHLRGFTITATDGLAGKVNDIYFDDQSWRVRYIVADLAGTLHERRILLAPPLLEGLDWHRKTLNIRISRTAAANSPNVNTELPVARVEELRLQRFFGSWLDYLPEALLAREKFVDNGPVHEDPHLRSTHILTGITVQDRRGKKFGTLADFLVDSRTWSIAFMLVGERRNERLIFGPEAVEDIDASHRIMTVTPLEEMGDHAAEFDPRFEMVMM